MSVLRILSTFAFAAATAAAQGCPNGTYILPSAAGTGYSCVTACPPRTFVYSNYCVTQCPNGTMTVNSTCIPAACPGGTVDPATGDCRCDPATSWIVRNPNAPPLTACAPKNDTTLPPIACGSFMADFVFIPELKDCQCGRAAPTLVYNQTDRVFPYACSAVAGVYPVRCTNTTDYFSAILGKCLRLPLPSSSPSPSGSARPSQSPSGSARPYEKPSESASPSGSASPTESPVPDTDNRPTPEASTSVKPSDRPTPEASTSVKPSVRPTLRPSEKVKPTQMPSVPISKRSALPTPRIPRTPPPSQRPVAIQNTLRLPGGTLPNSTDTAAAPTIQNIQAALACSHRLPPEQIRIRNVTVTTAAGAIWNPPLPAPLSTNGTIVCYNATVGAGLAARLRALSTSDIGVAVEYTIEGDAATAALLTPEDLTSTLVSSPMMAEVAASVGATGIAASTTDVSFGAAASGSPSVQDTNSSPIVMIVSGVGAALAAVAIVSAAVVLGIVYTRKPTATSRRTVVIVEQPPQSATSVMNPMTDRVTFSPTQRSRV